MSLYSIARRHTVFSTSVAAHTLITSATDRPILLEAGVFNATATACTWGLGPNAGIGSTATAPVALVSEDNGAVATSTALTALAWASTPTAPTQFHRRWAGPATIGTGVIFTFPRGIGIAVLSNYSFWNLAVNGICDSYFVIDE